MRKLENIRRTAGAWRASRTLGERSFHAATLERKCHKSTLTGEMIARRIIRAFEARGLYY